MLNKQQLEDMKRTGLSVGLTNTDIIDLFAHIIILQSELDQANANKDAAVAHSEAWQAAMLEAQREANTLKELVPEKVALPNGMVDWINYYLSRGCLKTHLLYDVIASPAERKVLDDHNISVEQLGSALYYGYTIEPEPTIMDKLRTSLTPVVEGVLQAYSGSMSSEITRELLDKIMPLTDTVIKAMEQEQQK